MRKVLNVLLEDITISSKLITFLSLSNVELIFFSSINPPVISVISNKFNEKFYIELYKFFFDNFKEKKIIISHSVISEQDYEELVIQYTDDIELNDFIITPRIAQYRKIPIYIRSCDFAEGTGAHITTQLILNHLNLIKKYKQPLIIDYGSGSGILSIASKKILPNSYIISIEINFKYLKEATKNYKLNQTEIIPILSNSINPLNLNKIKKNFSEIILLINVPIQILQTIFKNLKSLDFYPNMIILSGIKKPQNIQETDFIQKINNELLNGYLSKYHISTFSEKNWILSVAEL